MVRIIAGHGLVRTRYPPPPLGTEFPFSSTTSASIPGNGKVAEPGFSFVIPGSGVINGWPVSVCHQVSITGQRPPPIFLWYQTQASGLIGSPTVPSNLKLLRLCLAGNSVPQRMNVRIAVGAV